MNNNITIYGTSVHENDTKLTFTKTARRAEIELAFTSEDPAYGTETLICGGDSNETLMSLCEDQLNELTTFLDETYGGTYRPDEIMQDYRHLDDLNNSSLLAFERLLCSIVDQEMRKVSFGVNNNGHAFKTGTIAEVSKLIAQKFTNDEVKSVYIATDPPENGMRADDGEFYYKIVRLDLPFDNLSEEIALLMGYCGGGNVTMAYKSEEDDDSYFIEAIEKMICDSTGEESSTEVYAEFIGKNDKHSYEIRQSGTVSVETDIGTLVAMTDPGKHYPGIYVGLDRNGKHFGSALIEVDQYDPENPVLKTHVYNADPHEEEPEFDKYITPDEIDYYIAETNYETED